MVVVKGLEKNFEGEAFSCACDGGDGLRKNFDKDGAVCKSEEDVLFCSLRRKIEGPMDGVELRFDGSSKLESVRRDGESVVLSAEEKRERKQGNDGAVMLGLNGVLMRMLVSVVPASSKDFTVERELAYFSCQSEREALVYV